MGEPRYKKRVGGELEQKSGRDLGDSEKGKRDGPLRRIRSSGQIGSGGDTS